MSSFEFNLLESWQLGHVYYLRKRRCNILWSTRNYLLSQPEDISSGFRNGEVEWILEIKFVVRFHIVSLSKLLSCNVFRLTCSEFHFSLAMILLPVWSIFQELLGHQDIVVMFYCFSQISSQMKSLSHVTV